jgi:N-acyl amino acid synthase of PEP-CTERM/exosortase system
MTLHSVQQFSRVDAKLNAVLYTDAIGSAGFRDESLLESFNSQFDVLAANNVERIRIAQRIRYQVYCIEHPHESADNPDGLEMDAFDSHAVQSLLVHRAANTALGTVRLILPLADGLDFSFPLQRVLDARSLAEFKRLPLHTTGEVSRFSVSREFRRMAQSATHPARAGFIDNSALLMRLGLIQGLVRMSAQHGITHWCAAMEPTLLRILSAMAIQFHPIGPVIDYHGLRQPCYCIVADVIDEVKRNRPAFWSVLTGGSALFD